MKKLLVCVLIGNLCLSNMIFAGDEAVKSGTIQGAASVGVDLMAEKSAWREVKVHLKENWGKYVVGVVVAAVSTLVYINNDGFHGDDKATSSTTSTSANLTDYSLSVDVAGSYNTVNVYSNRDSDNGK